MIRDTEATLRGGIKSGSILNGSMGASAIGETSIQTGAVTASKLGADVASRSQGMSVRIDAVSTEASPRILSTHMTLAAGTKFGAWEGGRPHLSCIRRRAVHLACARGSRLLC